MLHTTATATVASVLLLSLASEVSAASSSKRGLVYVPSSKYPTDDNIWVQSGSDLTWYYNYGYTPSAPYLSKPNLQFVPMLWGAKDGDTSTTFLDSVTSQINGGSKIPYVLGFNEPNGDTSTGGSAIPADLAASTWIRQIEPLKKLGVKLGAPAMTGAPSGFTWLQAFFTACQGNCTPDFIPVHWYGNFEGLASHVGQVMGTYPNMSVWVTEYALNNADLSATQTFYNQSANWFDSTANITHYSYFGSFRSDVSNVGPNAAMLTQDGKLTDIGSWYLGGIPEVPSGIPSPPQSPPLAATATSRELQVQSPASRPSSPGKNSKALRGGAAAYHITEKCERLFCETLQAIFLSEGEEAHKDSRVMGLHMKNEINEGRTSDDEIRRSALGLPTSLLPPQSGLFEARGCVIKWLELWDYVGGARFRGYVTEKPDGERSMFIFLDPDVSAKDLKPGVMALLELSSIPAFACESLILCLDRQNPEKDHLAHDLGWVGFEPMTLADWGSGRNEEITSNRWFFLGMEL